jgi:ABC-2 type transport system ATP-binding protein
LTIIQTKNLVKHYGKTVALNDLNLEVKEGEVMGFIGPNGAGKTTTIRILLGLLRKDGGTASLFGKDTWENTSELHKKLAYVPGDVNLWPNLTGGEVIDVLGKLRGNFNPKRKTELLQRFDLDPTKKCRTYSKGNRQKVALVAAFASDVDLFILDEPTSGLDPLMEMIFQDCVAEAKKSGKTVLLSSHILAEVEKLCDQVSIIRQGRIVETGTLSQLRHLTRTSITVETGKPASDLGQLPGVYELTVNNNRAKFQVESGDLNNIMSFLTKYDIQAMTSTPPTLEELFMRHYGDDLSVQVKSGRKAR